MTEKRSMPTSPAPKADTKAHAVKLNLKRDEVHRKIEPLLKPQSAPET